MVVRKTAPGKTRDQNFRERDRSHAHLSFKVPEDAEKK